MHSEFMDMKLSDPVVNADMGDECDRSKWLDWTFNCYCGYQEKGNGKRPPVVQCSACGREYRHIERPELGSFFAKEFHRLFNEPPQRSDESYEQYRERIGVQ